MSAASNQISRMNRIYRIILYLTAFVWKWIWSVNQRTWLFVRNQIATCSDADGYQIKCRVHLCPFAAHRHIIRQMIGYHTPDSGIILITSPIKIPEQGLVIHGSLVGLARGRIFPIWRGLWSDALTTWDSSMIWHDMQWKPSVLLGFEMVAFTQKV